MHVKLTTTRKLVTNTNPSNKDYKKSDLPSKKVRTTESEYIMSMRCASTSTEMNQEFHWETSSIKEDNIDLNVPVRPPIKKLNLLTAILGECFCEPFTSGDNKGIGPSEQFIELHGIQFIGLGAVLDELTPKERVYDTLEQLTTRTQRLISIGYLVDDETDIGSGKKLTETIPLDIWSQTYPNDKNMSRPVKRTITSIKEKNYGAALDDFHRIYKAQKRNPKRNNNNYMLGITAHNMGVISVLAGRDQLALPLFEEAIAVKRKAFGREHPEVAVSLDELGIQLFARERFDEALAAFNEVKRIRSKSFGSTHPKLAMILNNIACCNFQMGNSIAGLLSMMEARDLQVQKNNSNSSAKSDLDLLYTAILLSNCGYLKLNLKQYEDARSCFEEALMIQQSVLGDAPNHRAIRDTRKNLEFTNAFHS